MTDLRRGRERFFNKWFQPVIRPITSIKALKQKMIRTHERLRHHFKFKKDQSQNSSL